QSEKPSRFQFGRVPNVGSPSISDADVGPRISANWVTSSPVDGRAFFHDDPLQELQTEAVVQLGRFVKGGADSVAEILRKEKKPPTLRKAISTFVKGGVEAIAK